ncbi:MAG TPA: DctP family TRAP transporter solute-binding subunit [Magnetospirillum sp.]|nr:DctP family TRAP transporter solute-binding subunit [Magnetospirillum sp.]
MRLRAIAAFVLSIGLAMVLAPPAQCRPNAQQYVIKFSHVATPDSPKGKAAEKFRELVEERSRGVVKVVVYPNSTAYTDKEEIEALQLGAVQMLAPSLNRISMLGLDEYGIFDLPYLFPDLQAVRAVTQGPIGARLLQALDSEALVGLAFWENGFKMITSTRPLRKPADMAGLKMRVQPSAVLVAQMKDLDAVPVVTSVSDIAKRLKSGMIDATDGPPSNILTQSMGTSQKYGIVTNHAYQGYVVIANAHFWNGLPPDIRTLVEGALKDATAYANDIAAQENEKALAAIKATGKMDIYQPTAEELAEWRKRLLIVHQEMAKTIGKDLLEAIYAENAKRGFSYPPLK